MRGIRRIERAARAVNTTGPDAVDPAKLNPAPCPARTFSFPEVKMAQVCA